MSINHHFFLEEKVYPLFDGTFKRLSWAKLYRQSSELREYSSVKQMWDAIGCGKMHSLVNKGWSSMGSEEVCGETLQFFFLKSLFISA